ncbi:hypothetical protein VTN96DRAFT_8183 [Rasamsonia emersonii]
MSITNTSDLYGTFLVSSQWSTLIPIPFTSARRDVPPPARPALVWPDDLIPTTRPAFKRDNFLPPSEEQEHQTNSLPTDGTWALFGSQEFALVDGHAPQSQDSSTDNLIDKLVDCPQGHQKQKPKVYRRCHWHESLTAEEHTLGKMVGSTYVQKTARRHSPVSERTSSSSALASLIRSAMLSRTTMESHDSEDKDREPGQAGDGRDGNEVAVESCSPSLGFAKMNFSAYRSPSHPGCPSPTRRVSQWLIDTVAAADDYIEAGSSGHAKKNLVHHTGSTKQERRSSPEHDLTETEAVTALPEWNEDEVAVESCTLSLEHAWRNPLAMCTVVEPSYPYVFAHRVRAFHGNFASQIVMDMRASFEAERAKRRYYGYSDDDDVDWLFGYPGNAADHRLDEAKRPRFLLIADSDYGCDEDESDIDGYDSCPDFIEYHTSKYIELLPCRSSQSYPHSCPDDWLDESIEAGAEY